MRKAAADGRIEGAPDDLPVMVFADRATKGSSLTLLALGDTSFCGRPSEFFDPEGAGPLLDDVAEVLGSGDVVFSNVEGVLAPRRRPGEKFVVDSSWAGFLARSGCDVANLANNHALDGGQEGLQSTTEALEAKGILVVGAGSSTDSAGDLVVHEVGGLRLGWLAAARTGSVPPGNEWAINELDQEALVAQAEGAAGQVDCLVVSLHCGYMWLDYPDPAMHVLGHRLAAVGADLVLMHHPHVLQGVEVTENGSVICYSLGNFLFDWKVGDLRSKVAEKLEREGGIFSFTLDSGGVASAVMAPTLQDDRCCIRWPSRDRADEILDRLGRISRELATDGWVERFHRQRVERNTGHGLKMVASLAVRGRFLTLGREMLKIRPRHVGMVLRWAARPFRSREP